MSVEEEAPQQWKAGGALADDMKQGSAPPKKGTGAPPKFNDNEPDDMPQFDGYNVSGDQRLYVRSTAKVIYGREKLRKKEKPVNFMPPPALPYQPQGNPPPMEFTDIAKLNEEDCRAALLKFVEDNFCYGSKPAKDMKITNIQGVTALHYTLETYTESRKTGKKKKPYKGGPIDGPENGPPPLPWNIPCNPDHLFENQKKKIEVPHTAVVKPCHKCDAKGYHVCWECHGWGRTLCDDCETGMVESTDAEGNPISVPCHSCHGTRFERCDKCGGDGRITCDKCDGYRRLKCFIQLKVKYINNKDDHIIERTDMPDELIRNVSGDLVFEQVLPQVWPITSYPVQEINENSIRLVDKHKAAFANYRQLQQREQLRAVPVTEVAYEWEETKSRYWIYGLERKVYCPDYPQQCCCGCSIL